VKGVLVDTGAELSWFPADVLESLGVSRHKLWRFRQANGTVLERWTGDVWVYAAGTRTVDEVVFSEPNDLVLLGCRSLEGLNLRVEPTTRSLVDAGPAPAAAAARVVASRELRGFGDRALVSRRCPSTRVRQLQRQLDLQRRAHRRHAPRLRSR
jgi:predicted aspartyl protease